MTALGNLLVAIPPTSEQIEIVRLVKEYSQFAEQSDKALCNALDLINVLQSSLIDRALKGELTPFNGF